MRKICLSIEILWTGLRALFIETINGSQWHKKKVIIYCNKHCMNVKCLSDGTYINLKHLPFKISKYNKVGSMYIKILKDVANSQYTLVKGDLSLRAV